MSNNVTTTDYIQIKEKIRNDAKKLISDILKISEDKIDVNRNLGEYGIDSILLKDFANRLSNQLNIQVSPTVFFGRSTLEGLVEYLFDEFSEEITDKYTNLNHNKVKVGDIKKSSKKILVPLSDKFNKSDNCVKHLEPVAIIGIDGIYPGSNDLEQFWNNLVLEKDLISEIPIDRWDWKKYYSENPLDKNKTNVRWGGFIEDIDKFDAKFFKISPREAEFMDPQHRLFLQTTWKAIEDAGYRASDLSGRNIGVFTGVQFNDYKEILGENIDIKAQIGTGNAHSMLSNRISYLLNLKGPSESIDTACSSSLVAIHRGVKSIQSGESELAIAGGVSLIISPQTFIGTSKLGILSPHGRCKTFDKSANGYVKGEGVGAIILKPLNKAIEDNDNIYAIIKGTIESHGGRANSLTAPNSEAQAEMLVKVYKEADIEPETISYIEAHGTGTELGDPVEIEGLKKAFSELEKKDRLELRNTNYCGIGSVKTNIGHLEPAAGMAGITKLILSLKYKKIPATIHLKETNPYIDLKNSPFYIVDKTKDWECLIDKKGNMIPRRAGVSSFGFGGTYAHVILEEYNRHNYKHIEDEPEIIVLSAQNPNRLYEYINRLLVFIEKEENLCLKELAYTLQVGREEMNSRIAIIALNIDDLKEKLETYLQEKNIVGKMYKKISDQETTKGHNKAERIRHLERLADLWLKGEPVDWKQLYKGKRIKRISIPTYPFEKIRYWIPNNKESIPNDLANNRDKFSNVVHETVYFTSAWEKSELLEGKKKLVGNILLFTNQNEIYEGLKKISNNITLIKAGDEFTKISEMEYIINPSNAEDYTKLFTILLEKNIMPTHVIHMWSNKNDIETEKEFNKSVYSIFNLCKQLIKNKIEKNTKIIYIYNSKREENIPEYEAVSGIIKTACLENSKITYKTLGIDKNDLQIELLISELEEEEKEVIYKDGERFKKTIREISISKKPLNNEEKVLKEKGVYIISGGTGGLGFIFAEHLAKNYKAKLVLVGRTEIDEKKQLKIDKLRGYGSEVLYLSKDVSKKGDVEKLINETKDVFYKINGIIHSAGIIKDSYIINKKEEEIEEVIAPKVYGTIWFDELTKNEELDFFMMFSSITAILGNAGQADYAYANNFMDSYAKRRNKLVAQKKRYGKTVSINWPLWREGGMKVDNQTEQMLMRNFGMGLLEIENGIKAFEDSLKDTHSQFIVLHGNRNKLLKIINIQKENKKYEIIERRNVLNKEDLLKQVEVDLIIIISNILKIDEIDIDTEENLSEFGFDSISFTEFSNQLNEKFMLCIMPAIFYEYSNLCSFAEYLVEEYSEKLNNYYSGSITIDNPSQVTSDIVYEEVNEKNNLSFKKSVVYKSEPVAIIGINGVMPESEDLEEFWNNIEAEKNLIREIPKERWDWEEIYGDPMKEPNKTNIKWGGFMKEVDKFDPLFFGISPKEAELMDPQQRIFLQVVWKTIEDAGYKAKDISGTSTGVFVGVTSSDYVDLLREHKIEIQPQIATGIANSVLVNRISYLLNLHGPSEPIDTACSSALTAVHRAVEAIQLGNCEMAIAGGINLIASYAKYIALSKAGMLCEDGRCKTFDKSANGYVRGEGAGAVLLKPLSKAIKDNDHIYGVIKGSHVNHGGHVNSLTTPNPNAQAEVIIKAWSKAGIDPELVGYIETHGTGTSLGDPIEINGLKKAFKMLYKDCNKEISKEAYCGIGSVKTNIGHLEIAAGIAGLMKVILAIKNKKIPASINIKEVNPYIELEGSPFYIVDSTRDWRKINNEPRRAGISSFGYGGTNAHIVIEEYEEPITNIKKTNKKQIIVLSAKNKERLEQYVKSYIKFIKNNQNLSLIDIAYTLQTGRETMEERLAIIVESVDELLDKLIMYINKENKTEGILQGNNETNFQEINEIDKLTKLAIKWIKGEKIDWLKLYEENPKKLSLPTYPFEKNSYWIKDDQGVVNDRSAVIHPLLHMNTSTLRKQEYTSNFTGKEYFLSDHIISGKKVLPGVAYLEMARKAGELAGEMKVRKVTDIMWMRPVVMKRENKKKVNIILQPEKEEVKYQVYTNEEDSTVINAEGKIIYQAFEETEKEVETLNINDIKNRCIDKISKEECYKYYKEGGFDYGQGFQGIRELYYSEDESIAELELPSKLKKGFEDYILHPSLLDGALQTVIGINGSQSRESTYVPFSIKEVEILSKLTEKCFSYVKASEKTSNVKKYNILITDMGGKVLIKIKDYTIRAFENKDNDVTYNKEIEKKVKEKELMELLVKVKNGEISTNKGVELLEEVL